MTQEYSDEITFNLISSKQNYVGDFSSRKRTDVFYRAISVNGARYAEKTGSMFMTQTLELVLNAILNQRSQDVLAANNWNVVQYSVLMHMLAQVCDMQVGELVHVIADAHIYDRHIPLIEELISRETHPAPIFKLNPDIKNFYDFTTKDITIENYVTGPQIKNIPIAV